MHDTSPTRLGIVRPSAASGDALVAEIEARVLTAELTRRLGPVLLDLRTDGDAIGRWQPLAHAAWPTAIDARLDAGALWSASVPITALFARTVEPVAAEVRARMLAHLGLIPIEPAPLDAQRLTELRACSVTPNDVWLVARAATAVATGDAAIDALVTPADSAGVAELDQVLDSIAAGAATTRERTVHSLQQQIDALRARVAELEAAAVRDQRELADRFDEVAHERSVLRERLERAELDRTPSVGG